MSEEHGPVPRRGTGGTTASRRLALAVLAAGLTKAAGAGPARAADAGTAEVHIDNFTFNPVVLTIVPGTTVTWINRDDIPHVVTDKSATFRSKALDTDDRFSHTFNTPGEVAYFCSLHPHMTGKVVVRAP